MKWDGDISTTVSCVDCDAWAKTLCKAQAIGCGCSGWELGNLWGEIEEFTSMHLGYDVETGEESPDGFDPKLSKVKFSVEDGVGY